MRFWKASIPTQANLSQLDPIYVHLAKASVLKQDSTLKWPQGMENIAIDRVVPIRNALSACLHRGRIVCVSQSQSSANLRSGLCDPLSWLPAWSDPWLMRCVSGFASSPWRPPGWSGWRPGSLSRPWPATYGEGRSGQHRWSLPNPGNQDMKTTSPVPWWTI